MSQGATDALPRRVFDVLFFFAALFTVDLSGKPAHNGLTDYGKDIVSEMNRQGIIVDEACLAKKMTEVQRQAVAEGKLPHVSWDE